MKKTLNNVELVDQETPLEVIIGYGRQMANDETIDQDFIIVTGSYRIEYHHRQQIFVVEQRHFDHIKLDENADS